MADTTPAWIGSLHHLPQALPLDPANPRDWLVPDILPLRGTALLTGVSGAMKTSFLVWALSTCFSDALDGPGECGYAERATLVFGPPTGCGLRQAGYGPIVNFVALESEEQTLQSVKALCEHARETDGFLLRPDGRAVTPGGGDDWSFIMPHAAGCPFSFDLCADPEGENSLYGVMREANKHLFDGWGAAAVVVVDTVSHALNGRDENASATMAAAARGLRIMQPTNGLAIGIHHGDASHNRWHSRGHTALPSGVDHVVSIQRKGDIITVRNLKARGFATGAVRVYQAKPVRWVDTEADGLPVYHAWEFEELPIHAPTKPTGSASKPTSGPPEAPAKPVKAEAPATPPKPPSGPALRGLPAKVWAALALVPGQRMAADVARELVVAGPGFADVPTARRAQRWGEVLASLEAKGLVVDGHLCHPAQPSAEADLL